MSWSIKQEYIRYVLHRRALVDDPILQEGQLVSKQLAKSPILLAASPLLVGVFQMSMAHKRAWMEKHSLDFPSICCVCGGKGTKRVDYWGLWPRRISLRKDPILTEIPHCDHHHAQASGNAIIHIEPHVHPVSLLPYGINIYSISDIFLKNLAERTQKNPMVPPWVVFACTHPWYGSWNQGAEEAYLWEWSNMFSALDRDAQGEYLDSVEAPPLWRTWALDGKVDEPPSD